MGLSLCMGWMDWRGVPQRCGLCGGVWQLVMLRVCRGQRTGAGVARLRWRAYDGTLQREEPVHFSIDTITDLCACTSTCAYYDFLPLCLPPTTCALTIYLRMRHITCAHL